MKKFITCVCAGIFLFILPLFFINVKATDPIVTYGNNTLGNVNNSYSLFVSIPDLQVGDDVELFYLLNTLDTPYSCMLSRNEDTTYEGLNFYSYTIRLYYTDTNIYTYTFNPRYYVGILFNCCFIESGLDSSITLNYSFVYLEPIYSNELPLQFQVDIKHTYERGGFGGLTPGIQVYYKTNYVSLAKFNTYHGATNINYLDSLNEVIDYWELQRLNFSTIGSTFYVAGNSSGFTEGMDSALNSDIGINKFWQLFTQIFSGIGSILSIQLFPGITLGVFLLLPLAFAIIGLILWIWRN